MASCWILLLSEFVTSDKIGVLPGFGAPPTAHYSGFVEVDPASGTNLFYYLVESQSQPSTDPLLWWMNGGPGASSLAGLLSENGPLLLNEAGRFMSNPYAWNRRANMLYVEFGPGVGYSFCANSSKVDVECQQHRSDCSPCAASDTSVAEYNVVLIEKLLTEVFPSLAGRAMYLVGESYAGVYIPTLASAMMDHFKDTSIVNLHGLWVTDPCIDNRAQFGWMDLSPDFCYRKGLISKEVHELITDPSKNCSNGRTALGDWVRQTTSETCRKAWRLYDLATAGVGDAVHAKEVPGLPMYIDPLNAIGPAGGADLPGYLGREDVRKALHATPSPNKVYHMELDNNGYKDYIMQYAACNLNPSGELGKLSMLDIYRRLIKSRREVEAAANFTHIIISSGDVDPVVGPAGTEAAVKAIGFPVSQGGDRRPWFYNATATASSVLSERPLQWGPALRALDAGAQIGGFVTNFDTGVHGVALDFVIARNAGHMVPAYAPQHSLHVIEAALLRGRPLSPRLPDSLASADDEAFYGYTKDTGGLFTAWVKLAMSKEFVSEDLPLGSPLQEATLLV